MNNAVYLNVYQDGIVKVGRSIEPLKRLTMLNRSNEIAHISHTHWSCDNAVELEGRIKDILKPYRYFGFSGDGKTEFYQIPFLEAWLLIDEQVSKFGLFDSETIIKRHSKKTIISHPARTIITDIEIKMFEKIIMNSISVFNPKKSSIETAEYMSKFEFTYFCETLYSDIFSGLDIPSNVLDYLTNDFLLNIKAIAYEDNLISDMDTKLPFFFFTPSFAAVSQILQEFGVTKMTGRFWNSPIVPHDINTCLKIYSMPYRYFFDVRLLSTRELLCIYSSFSPFALGRKFYLGEASNTLVRKNQLDTYTDRISNDISFKTTTGFSYAFDCSWDFYESQTLYDFFDIDESDDYEDGEQFDFEETISSFLASNKDLSIKYVFDDENVEIFHLTELLVPFISIQKNTDKNVFDLLNSLFDLTKIRYCDIIIDLQMHQNSFLVESFKKYTQTNELLTQNEDCDVFHLGQSATQVYDYYNNVFLKRLNA